MLEDIFRILEAERDFDSNRQEEKAVPDVIEEKTATEVKIPKKYRDDIEALRMVYGDSFLSGLCIDISLKEALELMPRERARVDAYTGLVSFLKAKMGIELIIKSQKTKEEKL